MHALDSFVLTLTLGTLEREGRSVESFTCKINGKNVLDCKHV